MGFFLSSSAYSQQYVPKDYLVPKHYEEFNSAKRYENEVREKPGRRSKQREEWFVISDRNSNYTYASKSLYAEQVNKLKFKDIAYVIEDDRGWLRLSTDNNNGIDLGWIPKSNVLQWRRSLHDSKSNISLKGFCQPKLKDFAHPLSKAVNIYDSPYCIDLLSTAQIAPLCFIYKVERDRKGNHFSYLVAHSDELSSRSCHDDLIGWIKSTDVTVWSGNVCLKVNANKEAVNERLAYPKYKARAFATKNQAKRIAVGNFARVDRRAIYWEESLDSGSPYLLREPVEHFRFPVFDQDSLTYSTKLIASFPSKHNANNSHKRKFAPEVLGILRKQLNSHIGVKLLDEQVGEHVADIEFIANVYLPKKQPDQVYNPFSMVLFMSENDLKSYLKELNLLSLALDLAKDKTRVQLQITLTEMARKFSRADLSYISNLDVGEVFDLMVGVKRGDFDVVRRLEASCKIKDLKNKEKCPDTAIKKIGDSIVESKKILEDIIKSKLPYEFKYSSNDNNTYYWIPIEYMC